MKKHLLIFCLFIFLTRISSAQNIGVNTDGSAPSTLFHTKNTIAGQNNYLRIENTQSGFQSAIQLLNSGTAGADWIWYIPGGTTEMRLYRAADLVTFLANGNVGIGTTVPGRKLEVIGDIKLGSAGYQVYLGENVTTAAKIGINFHTDADPNYWIGKPAGAWTQPLHISFYTGVKIGANPGYGGTRFYNNSDMATEIMSVGNGDNHVRVQNNLYAPIMYDLNDAGYYLDPASTSNLNLITNRTRATMGNSGLYNTPRHQLTADTRYWTGAMGWGTTDFNTIYSNWGSGFFDTWSSPGNAPGGSTHYVGLQGFHFNHGDGTNAYGFQMAMAGEADNRFFWRSGWPGPRPWVEMVHSGNIGSIGGGSFIQNQYGGAQSANYWISGEGRVGSWFRNSASGTGLYNEANGRHFYSDGSSYWSLTTGNGLIFRDSYGGTIQGYVYNDGTNFGILHRGGGWGIGTSTTRAFVNQSLMVNGSGSPSYALHVLGDVYANGGWFRVSGTQGLYWESYGPGWYVQDGTWLRTYNNASIWANTGTIATNGSFSSGYGGAGGPSGGAIIAGTVGIGTSGPSYKFHVYNSAAIGATSLSVSENTGTSGVALSGYNMSGSNNYNATEGYTLGTYSGVWGSHNAGGGGTGGTFLTASTSGRGMYSQWPCCGSGWATYSNGDVGYSGWHQGISDTRVKKDIREMENALSMIMNLRPVTFEHKLDEYPEMGLREGIQYGFIAQEVDKAIPNIVHEKYYQTKRISTEPGKKRPENDKELFYGIDEERIIPILTKAIQEQQAIIESLKKQLEEQNERIKILEKK